MEELSLFDFPQVEITKPIRLIELFGGIGSQAMALRDIGANFEHYRLVEFDKYAVASYNAIHGTNFTTTDIRDVHGLDMGIVNRQEFTYLLTYSFPCTDLSVAGKMKGMSKEDWKNGNSTRSGLLWEVERILKELKDDELPQILLMENVPQVHSEQNLPDFESWLNFLRSRGYYNFYQDLNAKDYGIPQNRERCFCVSILSDDFIEFNFPKPIKLETVMKDYLEEEVDEKYSINTGKAKALIRNLLTNNQENQNGVVETIDLSLQKPKKIKIANCISARNDRSISNLKGEGSGVIESWCVAMRGRNPEKPTSRKAGLPTEQRLEKAPEGMVNTLTTVQKDNLCLEIKKVGQISNDGSQYGTVISDDGLCSTLTAGTHGYANNCISVKQATKEGTISERQNSIKAKRLSNGNIRFYRDDEKKSAVSELQVQSGADVAQTITVANVPKIYKEDQVEIKQATKEGSIRCKVGGCYDASYPDSKTRRDRVQDNGDTVPTLTASSSENINYVETVYRIRKLTPKECFRLMGYTDRDFEQAAKVNSNSQLYRQAGNAIVKQVLEAIFLQMNIQGLPKWNDTH